MRIFLSVLVSFFLFSVMPAQAQSYKKMWKKVEMCQQKDLPKSVVESAYAIYQKAKARQDAPQMMKAYLTMMNARYRIVKDSLETDIAYLEHWAETEEDSVDAAVLYSILGEISLKQSPEKALDYLFRSLQPVEALKRCPAESYVPLVEEGEASVQYEGNLMYPVLVRRAIDLLREYRYSLSNTVPNLSQIIEELYQSLLTYFGERHERAAYVLLKLDEMDFHSAGLSEKQQQMELCRKLINEYGEVVTCAEVYGKLAQLLRRNAEKKEAFETLEAGIKRYPKYERINVLKNLLLELTNPMVTIEVETLYPGKEEPLRITYRNVAGFDLKIYRTEVKEIEKIATYNKKDPFWKDKWQLFRTEHYALNPSVYAAKDTVLTLTMPEEGYYLLEAVPQKGTRGEFTSEPKLAYVSVLGIIASDLYNGGRRAMVVDRMSGNPVKDAQIKFYFKSKDGYVHKTIFTANRNGIFSWGKSRVEAFNRRMYFHAVTPEHPCMPLLNCWEYDTKKPSEGKSESMVLFTDRNLYRPGQVVYVSGISFGKEKDSLYVNEKRKVNLELRDANNKQIAAAALETNEFGSFHTSFTLPSVCLPGTFYLHGTGEDKEQNKIRIKVEEYKRPLFEVKLDPVKVAYTYGDTVWIRGNARMFTGMSVQDAEVKYRIKRREFYWMPDVSSASQAGNVRTDSAGVFTFPLVIGKKRISGSGYWSDYYQYMVEVNTATGDTQSAEGRLSVTEKPYLLSFSIANADWIKEEPDPWTLGVQNNNYEDIKVKVRYEVRELFLSDDKKEKKTGKCVYLAEAESNTEFVPEGIYRLPSGNYRLKMSVMALDKTYSDSTDISLFALSDGKLPAGKDLFLHIAEQRLGKKYPVVYLGTSLKDVHLFSCVYTADGRIISRHISVSDTIYPIAFGERYGEIIAVDYAFVKNGKMYHRQISIPKQEPDKKLRLTWQTFRDKLQAGAKEEWRLRVTDAKGKPVSSELLATLYDASLDKLSPRSLWNIPLSLGYSIPYLRCHWYAVEASPLYITFPITYLPYTNLVYTNIVPPFGVPYGRISIRGRAVRNDVVLEESVYQSGATSMKSAVISGTLLHVSEDRGVVLEEEIIPMALPSGENESAPNVRQNFAETAFFYPQLRTNDKGEVDIVFTLPESVTTWRFMGLAHTKEMDYAVVDTTAVASKEFMLQAQLPRFVRVGDRTSFAVTLSNLSGKPVEGTVRMELFDPITEKVFHTATRTFRMKAGRTEAVSFSYDITAQYQVMACRLIADGGTFSDGEQHLLPVLSNKEWITESVAVSMNQPGMKTVELKELFNDQSPTAMNRHLTVEFTDNPSWLAVMALSSIGQPSDKNALSLTAAYYSASLASWVVEKNPRIRTMFEAWKAQGGSKDMFLSELQQNQELKELVLEASPFLLDAESETEQRHRLATLFDQNTLQNQKAVYLDKLKALQTDEGGWSWYKGMDANRYMTTAIAETLLRLKTVTGEADHQVTSMLEKGWTYLDGEAVEEYKWLLKQKEWPETLSEFASHYLYLCMLAERQLAGDARKAYAYFFKKLKGNIGAMTIYGKAVAAMVLAAGGEQAASDEFVQSLLEYSAYTPEMGRYYDTNIALSTWADFRIPTQTMAIEALVKLGKEKETVAQMQQWLLKQKQVQSWDTPVNTVNAVYALLLDNASILANQPAPELLLDGKPLSVGEISLGLNSIKETLSLPAGTKAPQTFTVRKKSDGVAWGAVYAQYAEEMNKVSGQSEGLSVVRTFYVERLVDGKLRWVELKEGESLKTGDKLKSSLEVKTDRDMDFVQLKENRASCMEPAAVMSGYRWSNGVGYYRAIKDASMEYYMDRLRKGSCTLESIYYMTLEGVYETGSVKVQSAYAPEFNAHTPSVKLEVGMNK